MNRFTDLALDKNALDFQDLFQEVLSQKVSDALDAKKVEIAATMFEDPAIAEEKIEMTRGGRATGNAIADIVAKNNARLAKQKADRAKHLRKKEKYDGGVKEDVESIDEVSARVRTGRAHSGQPNGEYVKAIVSNHQVGKHNLKVRSSIGWDGDRITHVSHVKDGKAHPVGMNFDGHYVDEYHKSGTGITPKMAKQAIAAHHANPTVKKKLRSLGEEVEEMDEAGIHDFIGGVLSGKSDRQVAQDAARSLHNKMQLAKNTLPGYKHPDPNNQVGKKLGVKEKVEQIDEVELDEGMVDHIAKVHVHGSNVTLHMDNGKKSTQKHPSPEAALKDGKAYHKATGREAKLVVTQ